MAIDPRRPGPSGRAGFSIAADVGGTCTDLALSDGGGRLLVHKLSPTPAALEQPLIRGTAEILEMAGATPSDPTLLLNGTAVGPRRQRRRDPLELIEHDRAASKISRGYAARWHGVIVHPASLAVDRAASLRRRSELRRLAGAGQATAGSGALPVAEKQPTGDRP